MTLELGVLISMLILSIWGIYMVYVANRSKREEGGNNGN